MEKRDVNVAQRSILAAMGALSPKIICLLAVLAAAGSTLQAQTTTLKFEPIYSAGGSNYAAGNYDVGQPGQYNWSFSGTRPTDVANHFIVPTQTSDDGIKITNGSFTINFANPISNLKFSFSDFDGGIQGVHTAWEKLVLRVYDINNVLLNPDLYIEYLGNRVSNSAVANTYDGKTDQLPDLVDTDINGTLRFNFGSNIIDRIEVTTGVSGATLRFQEPTFNACSLSASNTVTPVSCSGGANGAINMTLTGGTAPYSWNWSRVSPAGSGSGTGTSITGLSAGTYNVTVSSAVAGCNTTFSALVTQPTAVTATATPVAVACFGQSTGAVNLSPGGGTPGYTYSWTGPGGFTAGTQNLSNRPAGTYNVTVTDSRGCTAITSATITAPASALAVVLSSKTDVNCGGGNTGTINITASGGTPAYTYAWNDGITTEDRSGLAAGTYSVTVTDARGCTSVLSGITISVLQNTALTIQSTNVACFGNSNGSIQVTATGLAPFNVAWTGPSSGNPAGNEIAASGGSYTLSGLSAGTYNGTVNDANNCTSTFSRTVGTPAALSATPTVTNFPCFGQTGGVNLSVSGGTPAYTYSWTGPGGFTATTQNISGLLAGTYNVTVTDSKGCMTLTSAMVTGPASVLALVLDNQSNNSCNGGSTGIINITASGGTPAYTYLWSDGATVQDRSGLAAGAYSLTVTDANGCSATLSATITQPPPLVLSVTNTNPTCPPGANPPVNSDGAINLSAAGGTGTFTYAWTTVGGSGLNPGAEDQSGLTAGTYTVTVTDLNGCTATLSVTLTNLNPLPVQPGTIIINN